jgi:pyruvate/2-oxoglutarate dehydrogenase complex dihydrolipoamide acyltransferase (E2) component
VDAFRALLAERGVSTLCLWEREAAKLAADPRFAACPGGARGRKEAFEAWCRDGGACAAAPAASPPATAGAPPPNQKPDDDRKKKREREQAAAAARRAAENVARRREADACARLHASAHGRAVGAFTTLLAEEKVGAGEGWTAAWAGRLAARGGAAVAPLTDSEREGLFLEHVRRQVVVRTEEVAEEEEEEEEGEAPLKRVRAVEDG